MDTRNISKWTAAVEPGRVWQVIRELAREYFSAHGLPIHPYESPYRLDNGSIPEFVEGNFRVLLESGAVGYLDVDLHPDSEGCSRIWVYAERDKFGEATALMQRLVVALREQNIVIDPTWRLADEKLLPGEQWLLPEPEWPQPVSYRATSAELNANDHLQPSSNMPVIQDVSKSLPKTEERGMKYGTAGRVNEFHRLVKSGYSYRQAKKKSCCDPDTYRKWCKSVTGAEPIMPHR